ncbi:GNAT family N-acetyltransferase [Bosea sp. (in: a-proteobacteria)]|uniref:GNAT family N-acetyltransferase n=1 Tax=Bosea sp. (in: a-proteobacteria) TaxID=1871050 RepID=UPI0025C3E3FD|nr:GNAT family N-acetyltransferase [Bosea sp. (in: a-proteobacteria)]MBR3194031.1 GNAT family N-acetyltransferase [Bosea sp. (in: a-proteobacteria)]
MSMPSPSWRNMSAADLPAIMAAAAEVHPDYPEGEAVFTERLALHPAGCLVLAGGDGIGGYVLSHPWRFGQVPALDSLLGALPEDADIYYIHDLALLPLARGGGAASACVHRLAAHARAAGFARMALVAVGNSAGFWQRQDFREAHDEALARKLASYDSAARYMIRDLKDDGRNT